jgi:hypothetical protein
MCSLLWLKDCGFAETCVRSCRNCENYVRIESGHDGKPSVNALRGFCVLGQGESDFGLYISSSKSGDCEGFMFSQSHVLLTEEEQRIAKDFWNFTKQNRKKVRREIDKADHAIRKKTKMMWFSDWMEEDAELNRQFIILHMDGLVAFRKKFELSWKDYMQLVDLVANFCKQYVAKHRKSGC